MINDLKAVHDFWNSESCGERYAVSNSDKNKFYIESIKRYQLEPYIKEFANFPTFKNKDVLEIGVGFGSDHQQIALSGPNSLTGVDLTQRSIDNTKLRFKILNLKSSLKIDNAEKLSFKSETFDCVYSWGVLHHSPNTKKCFREVYRVLKPGGIAKVMIYHKFSVVGLMLWFKYGFFKFNPFIGLNKIYSEYLESPGTKAYSKNEAYNLTELFSYRNIKVQLSFGDLLKGDVGARHKGFMLSLAKIFFPRKLIILISLFFPVGLYLLIDLKK